MTSPTIRCNHVATRQTYPHLLRGIVPETDAGLLPAALREERLHAGTVQGLPRIGGGEGNEIDDARHAWHGERRMNQPEEEHPLALALGVVVVLVACVLASWVHGQWQKRIIKEAIIEANQEAGK